METIDWTFDNLYYLVQLNPYLQWTIGILSVLLSIVLFYVVSKLFYSQGRCDTRDPMRARTVIDFVKSPINSSRLIEMFRVASTTFTANSAITGSVSYYLGTMEGVRQSNCFLDWYSKRTFFTKSVIITCSHTAVTIWSGISLFVSVDFNEQYTNGSRDFLRERYSLIHMKANTVALSVLGISCSFFIVFYFFQLIYLNRGVQQQLESIKSTISPRTWELLHHTSFLFLGIAAQPIFSFIVPTVIFIPMNFAVTFIGSSVLLNASVLCTVVLYTSSTLQLNLFTLVPFKIYRHHFLAILKAPFASICTKRTRRVSVAPQLDFVEMNKVTA